MFRKILNTFGTKCFGAMLTFIIAMVISHNVGAVGKGEQSLLLTTITFILIASDIVSGGSLVYLVPKHRFSKLLLPAYTWSVFIGLLAIVIIPILLGGMAWLCELLVSIRHLVTIPTLSYGLLINIGVLSILSSVNSVNTSILIGYERVREANYLNLWQPIGILLTLLICYFGLHILNLNAYIIALYVAYGGSWIGGLILLRKKFRDFSFFSFHEYRNVLKDLFYYGTLNELGTVVQKINMRVNYFLFPIFFGAACFVNQEGKIFELGEHYTGIFSNAVSLAEAIWIISRSIALVQYARIVNTEDVAYAQKLTLDLTKVCLAVSAVGMFCLSLLPSSFYVFFFGPDFVQLPTLIRILIPGALMSTMYLIVGHYYSGRGKYQVNLYAALCGLFFTITLGFLLIPRYNVYGAAVATSVAYTANAAFLVFLFLKESHFRFYDFILTRQEWTKYVGMFKQYVRIRFKKNVDEKNM